FAFFFQAEDGIRDFHVTGVQTCALPILAAAAISASARAFCRPASAMASFLAASTIWLARWWACSMTSLALARASRRASLALSCRSEERRVGQEGRCRASQCL